MLIEWLLDIFQTAISGVLSMLPDDNTGFATALSTLLGNLGALNYFLPISETFALVVGVLFVFPFFMGTSLALWIIAQLRGSSSRG